jgi:uncharacterized protein involved in type VI secretion and phage assembly
VLTSGGGEGRAGQGSVRGVLTGARAAVERHCDGEEDRRWLELAARAQEGTRELESGWGRGVARSGENQGGVTASGNGGIMALTPLKAGAG